MKTLSVIPIVLVAMLAMACKPEPIEPPTPMADSVFFYEQRLYAPGDYVR